MLLQAKDESNTMESRINSAYVWISVIADGIFLISIIVVSMIMMMRGTFA